MLSKKEVAEIVFNTLAIQVEHERLDLVCFDMRQLSAALDRNKYIFFGNININLPLELFQNPYQTVAGTTYYHGLYASLDLPVKRCLTTYKSNYLNWRIFNDTVPYVLFDELHYLPDNWEHITNYGMRNGNQLLDPSGVTTVTGVSAWRIDKAYHASGGTQPFVEPILTFTGYRIRKP